MAPRLQRERASWRRVGKALVLGHLAAAIGFSVALTLFQWLVDPDAARALARGAFGDLAEVAAGITVFALIAMLPASLLTSPFTVFAARRLRGSAAVLMSVGAAIGAAECAFLLATSGGFQGPWSRPGLPGDPRSEMMIVACGAAAGMAYAWVVWRLCIEPYRCAFEHRSLSPG